MILLLSIYSINAYAFPIGSGVNIGNSTESGEIITSQTINPTELTFNNTIIVLNYTTTQTQNITFAFNHTSTGRAILIINEPLDVVNANYTYWAGNGTLNIFPELSKSVTIVYSYGAVVSLGLISLAIILMFCIAIPIVLYISTTKRGF